jgi:hypothetical protein
VIGYRKEIKALHKRKRLSFELIVSFNTRITARWKAHHGTKKPSTLRGGPPIHGYPDIICCMFAALIILRFQKAMIGAVGSAVAFGQWFVGRRLSLPGYRPCRAYIKKHLIDLMGCFRFRSGKPATGTVTGRPRTRYRHRWSKRPASPAGHRSSSRQSRSRHRPRGSVRPAKPGRETPLEANANAGHT